jgi:hypothetical protein
MIDYINLIAAGWVALLWTTVGFAIRRWGPGKVELRTHCPERKLRADIVVLLAEGGFGEIYPTDVARCSLLGNAAVTCERGCLAQV